MRREHPRTGLFEDAPAILISIQANSDLGKWTIVSVAVVFTSSLSLLQGLVSSGINVALWYSARRGSAAVQPAEVSVCMYWWVILLPDNQPRCHAQVDDSTEQKDASENEQLKARIAELEKQAEKEDAHKKRLVIEAEKHKKRLAIEAEKHGKELARKDEQLAQKDKQIARQFAQKARGGGSRGEKPG